MKKIALVLVSLMIFTLVALAVDMNMVSVESSLLDKVGYDAATQTLVVQMVNSSELYTYQNVPQSIYDGLLAADSKGSYFAKNIKGQYERGK